MSLVGVDRVQLASEANKQLSEAYATRGSDINHSVEITQSVLQRCIDNGFEEGIAKAKNQLGLFYLVRSDFEKAERYSRESLQYFEKHNDIKGVADAHYNIGGIYYRTNKYHQGLIELLKSLEGYKLLSDHHNQSRTHKSMGTIYEYFNDLNKASDAYLKAIEASKIVKDESLESNALNPLSSIYYKQGLTALAVETIDRSVKLKIKTADKRGLAFALYGRAKIYIKEDKPELALG